LTTRTLPPGSGVPAHTLVCFGLIGSTVADDGIIERAYAEAIATQGVVTGTTAYARGMAQVHRARGKAVLDVLRELFPDNEARAQAALLAFDKSLGGMIQWSGVTPVPGAGEVLDGLVTAGIRVCILSSLSHRQLGAFLTALEWQDRVDVMLGADDVPRGAPHPDPVLAAMLAVGVEDVRETAVVQGTDSGILAGRRAGATLVAGVLTGTHPPARLRGAGATHLLGSVADLPGVLAGQAGLVSGRVIIPRPAAELTEIADPAGDRAAQAVPQEALSQEAVSPASPPVA
jgi:phosphonatase-like hydrolase